MILAIAAVVVGLALLVWSAGHFVSGSSLVAKHFGIPPLLIGIVIVGFGTSAPELMVSSIAAFQGNSGLALGNAFGSNIGNIGLILGISALIHPITVHSAILRKELPILMGVTVLTGFFFWDNSLRRIEALALLVVFLGLTLWSIWEGLRQKNDALGLKIDHSLESKPVSLKKAIIALSMGLVFLLISSKFLVWGAVILAKSFGVSDLLIGLTIVALGTSLPELASSIIAIRRGEYDIALGNVLGSNLFNTLAVIGIAGVIHPFSVESEVFLRDFLVMAALTLSLFILGYGFKGTGRINRFEGAFLLLSYCGYIGYLINSSF